MSENEKGPKMDPKKVMSMPQCFGDVIDIENAFVRMIKAKNSGDRKAFAEAKKIWESEKEVFIDSEN